MPYKAIVLTPETEEKLPSGIIVPNEAQKEPTEGEVLMRGHIPDIDTVHKAWLKNTKVGTYIRMRKNTGLVLDEISLRHRLIDIRNDILYVIS